MDNFAGAQWASLSTAKPSTPVVSRGRLREKQTTKEQNGQQPNKPHGLHLNPAARLSKGWGPPLGDLGFSVRDWEGQCRTALGDAVTLGWVRISVAQVECVLLFHKYCGRAIGFQLPTAALATREALAT